MPYTYVVNVYSDMSLSKGHLGSQIHSDYSFHNQILLRMLLGRRGVWERTVRNTAAGELTPHSWPDFISATTC